jgi:hypothetical protein
LSDLGKTFGIYPRKLGNVGGIKVAIPPIKYRLIQVGSVVSY